MKAWWAAPLGVGRGTRERHAVPRAWPPPTKFRPGIWGVGQVVVPYGGYINHPGQPARSGVSAAEGARDGENRSTKYPKRGDGRHECRGSA